MQSYQKYSYIVTSIVTCCLLHAESTKKASDSLGDAMMVAGAVGIPVYMVLLVTIGPSEDSFSNVNSMLEQVASYQFVGTFHIYHLVLCM